MNESHYPEMWQLILGYFNEDSNEWGNNVGKIIQIYKKELNFAQWDSIISEIDRFKVDECNHINISFEKEFGCQFNPKLWGYTTASFLDELRRLLQE